MNPSWTMPAIGASIALLALYGIFGGHSQSLDGHDFQAIGDQRPDALMESVTQHRFNADGQRESVLTATRMVDFGPRASAQLTDPHVHLERGPAVWTLLSRFGELSANRVELTLTEQVQATRNESGMMPWDVKTDHLVWNQSTDIVRSDSTTLFTRGDSRSTGDSVILDLTSNEYTLGNKVKTQWQSSTSSQSR